MFDINEEVLYETKSQTDLALRHGRERSRGAYGAFNQEYERGEKIKKGERRSTGPGYANPKDAEEAHKAMQPMKTADSAIYLICNIFKITVPSTPSLIYFLILL